MPDPLELPDHYECGCETVDAETIGEERAAIKAVCPEHGAPANFEKVFEDTPDE